MVKRLTLLFSLKIHFLQDGPEEKNKEIEDQLLHLKGQVEEMTFANRQLKSELTDAQTNLALVKGEFATVKQQFNEKIHDLEMWVTVCLRGFCFQQPL